MTAYLGSGEFEHGRPARAGVLLVNLGTPEAPTPRAVRRYLAEFLSDPRVIEMPRALWWLVLHGVILRIRPRRSAHAYAKIWSSEGSPLLVESRRLADALAGRLAEAHGDRVRVELGMTYGSPSIADALERLRRDGVRRLLVLPMYPQYSATTAAPVFERVAETVARWRRIPDLRFVSQYWEEDAYVAAIAGSITRHWQSHGRKHLLFSFHSIPRRYFAAGDPYHCFCQASARRIAARLGLEDADWSLGFQSRFGREEWLRPYVDQLLVEHAKAGRRRVTVVCPGFATDCLETLEEIAMQDRDLFLANGGEAYDVVPCLNSDPAHVDLYAHVVERNAQDWPEFAGSPEVGTPEDSRRRALAMGAPR
jgi:ferrochelatase